MAAAKQPEVDMEMVGMIGIIIWAQDHVEPAAGTKPHLAQETRRLAMCGPVLLERDVAAIAQLEA